MSCQYSSGTATAASSHRRCGHRMQAAIGPSVSAASRVTLPPTAVGMAKQAMIAPA